MIFASAGHRKPFNRLMRLLDGWAATRVTDLFAQVGQGGYRPIHFPSAAQLSSGELDNVLRQSRLIIADTNIELLIAATAAKIPMIVLPRQSIFGEDIGSVQGALARRLSRVSGIIVAAKEAELLHYLDECHQGRSLPAPNAPDRKAMVSSILGHV